MTNQELNQYILHYIDEDKTNSAIMLTAPWGAGKSYYIQNELKPFLERKENGGYKCIVISLYGMTNLFEVSKALYLENRAKILNIDSEIAVAGKLAAKTIIQGITSFFSVELSKTDAEMQELFESIDLSGKIIILEDLERSGIDILTVLGYVNNLVEQDGAKVLLVANEEEIIKYEYKGSVINKRSKIDAEKERSIRRVLSHIQKTNEDKNDEITLHSETVKYFQVKEKTISDTIQFEEDYPKAIENIIRLFGDETLDKFSNSGSIKDILDVMKTCDTLNLRSLIYACQKASDIYKKIGRKYLSDDDFIRAIFFGILFFVFTKKSGISSKWGQEKYFSVELGNEKAPLFKFCYDYITRQVEELGNIEETYSAYMDYILYDRNRSYIDNDIISLQRYYVCPENKVISTLNRIENRLKNPDDISFFQYGTIAVYAIAIKEILGCNIDTIKERLVNNLRGKGNRLQLDQILRTAIRDKHNDEQVQEFESLRKEMAEALKTGCDLIPNFTYLPEQSNLLYEYAIKNQSIFILQNGFAKQLDIKLLSVMFNLSTAEQMDYIRCAFTSVYSSDNIGSFLSDDLDSLIQLLDYVKENQESYNGDKIQRLQYDYFVENLTVIINKLS